MNDDRLHTYRTFHVLRLAAFFVALSLYTLTVAVSNEAPYWQPEQAFFAISRGVIAACIAFVAVPMLLQKNRVSVFLLIVLMSILTYSVLEEVVLDPVIYDPGDDTYSIDGEGLLWASLNSSIAVFTIVGFVIFTDSLLSRRKLAELEKMKTRAELLALQHQLNPHILLNGLNNIYALSISGSDKTSEAVLGLADILKYALYETGEAQVDLNREIELIENYIALQELGIGDRVSVSFHVIGNPYGATICPLLLLPIVENAFKHADMKESLQDEGAMIAFKLTISDDGIEFQSTNPYDDSKPQDQNGGVGLDNIRMRLNAIYPRRHRFGVDQRDGVFRAVLFVSGAPE